MYGRDADGHGRKRGRAEAEQDISCGTPGRSAAEDPGLVPDSGSGRSAAVYRWAGGIFRI